jgi:septum formation protein
LPTDETYPDSLPAGEVAAYISLQKAEMFREAEFADKLILTSDTVVVLEKEVLTKPVDSKDAFDMLSKLSGKEHEVVTAVSLLANGEITTVSDVASVSFRKLENTNPSTKPDHTASRNG